jgi:hypothetical protein
MTRDAVGTLLVLVEQVMELLATSWPWSVHHDRSCPPSRLQPLAALV